jgi:hypothetical protein
MWATVEGWPETYIIRALRCSEGLVQKHMKAARCVMAWGAVQQQKDIVLGKLAGGITAECEADETEVGHWRQDEIHDGKAIKVWYWYVWVGILQRGDPSKFFICELGVSQSRGKPRIPKMKNESWAGIARAAIDDKANIVLHTDSADAYAQVGHPGVVDKRKVNHSQGEFSRSVSVLNNVNDRTTRPALAGTMCIDQEWRRLLEPVPDNLSCKTKESRAAVSMHIRSSQWFRWIRNADRWPSFCQAVGRWTAAHKAPVEEPVVPKEAGEEIGPDLVQSVAGGFAERCSHVDMRSKVRCEQEVHACCVECLDSLCARHYTGVLFQSRCHEHNKFVRCDCLECEWGWPKPEQ